nr:glycosyltransferase family 4 protein [Marmoricola sp. Leaf446]
MTSSSQPPSRNTPAVRTLVVTTSLSPQANELWEATCRHGAEVLIVGSSREDPLRQAQPVATYLPLREWDGGRGLIWRHLQGLRSVIRRFAPDIVHVNGELWSWTVQQLLHMKLPIVAHGAENLWLHGGGLEQQIRRNLVGRAVHLSSGYASWNHAGRAHIDNTAPPGFPTIVLPAIIPPHAFRDAHWRGPNGRESEQSILLVGRLVALKGFDIAIRAAAILGEHFDLRVRICGQGPEEAALRALARTLDVRVDFLGQASAADLAEEMSRNSILVQPSRSTPDNVEQFGRSVAEGMTVGIPCVVSDSGELPQVVGMDPIAIFAEGDHVDLARRLEPLLHEPVRLRQLSETQSELSAAWDPSHAGAEMLEFWSRVLLWSGER